MIPLDKMNKRIQGRAKDIIGTSALILLLLSIVSMYSISLNTGNYAKAVAYDARFDADVAQIAAGAADIKADVAYRASVENTPRSIRSHDDFEELKTAFCTEFPDYDFCDE